MTAAGGAAGCDGAGEAIAAVAGSQRISSTYKASVSTGLATKSFMPAARQARRSSLEGVGRHRHDGHRRAARQARISRVAARPSITGICMSISTRSYRCPAAFCSASAPCRRCRPAAPCHAAAAAPPRWLMRLSSTSSSRALMERSGSQGCRPAWRQRPPPTPAPASPRAPAAAGGEPEAAALPGLAAHADLATHQRGQAPRDGQAQPGAAEAAGGGAVGLLEGRGTALSS
jgi:hypothetical protein